MNESTVEAAVSVDGVFCAISERGSTDTPTNALADDRELPVAGISMAMLSPNGLAMTSNSCGFTLAILKMALGFSLEMKPSNCQDTPSRLADTWPPTVDGHPKYMDPPNPSLNGTWNGTKQNKNSEMQHPQKCGSDLSGQEYNDVVYALCSINCKKECIWSSLLNVCVHLGNTYNGKYN